MPSTFFGLGIGVSGMQAYQAALNTTAHNTSNIGTNGYTRQTTVRSAGGPISFGTSYGMVGTGVRVTDIVQTRNIYYDRKYRYNNTIYNENATKNYYLSCIEDNVYTADKDTGGLYLAFDSFFGSLTTLNDSSDKVIRTEAVNYANTFTIFVNDLANNLKTLQEEANFEIKVVTDQINAIAEKIASLNMQITTLEVRGDNANDLRDARNTLIDELSEFVHVTVTETEPPEGGGNSRYIVSVGGNTLVDSSTFKTIQVTPRTTRENQNDAEGLYDLVWSDGLSFNMRNTGLGGKLQALLEVRDGNNGETFQGKITAASTTDQVTKVTVTNANVNDVFLLNIPENAGTINIGNILYEYDSFEVQIEADGSYTYTFQLKGALSEEKKDLLQDMAADGKGVQIGSNVNYKGIPHYMSLLNEFVRTFSASFNAVHKEGYDMKGNAGLDFFNAGDRVTGENYVFTETGSFSSIVTPDAQGINMASYYSMTALNFTITQDIVSDVNKLACSSVSGSGVSNNENVARLTKVKDDNNMFRQGTPDGFLQTLVSSIGIDAQKAETFMLSQANIVKAIDNRRASISGVDEDEEAADLIKFQNLLNFQYKVISIMDEVLDKLINGMAV